MDSKTERTVTFDTAAFRQFDHGYAVTSHSSQGLTAGRVLAHFDTESSHSLINTRLAYVAISRASDDARVYTNNAETLGARLATDISKTAAVDFRPPSSTTDVQQAVAAFRANDPATGTTSYRSKGVSMGTRAPSIVLQRSRSRIPLRKIAPSSSHSMLPNGGN